jgi:hypothetical protein
MRSPSIRITLLASGGPPKPSIKRPPTKAVRPAEADRTQAQNKPWRQRKVRMPFMAATVAKASARFQLVSPHSSEQGPRKSA